MSSWLWFSGSKLYVGNAGAVQSFGAVSGKPSAAPTSDGNASTLQFSYSRKRQADKDSGPLPEGNYKVRPKDVMTYGHTKGTYVKAALYQMYREGSATEYLGKMDRAWGRIPGASGRIVPILSNTGNSEYAFGRDRCWIHGSDFPGSIGCIDLTSRMDAFLAILEACKADSLPLRVFYGVSPDGKESRDVDQSGRDVSRVA